MFYVYILYKLGEIATNQSKQASGACNSLISAIQFYAHMYMSTAWKNDQLKKIFFCGF